MEPSGDDMTVLAEFVTPELAQAAASQIIDRRIAAQVVESAPDRWSVLVPREELAAAGEAIVVPRRLSASEERLEECPNCRYDLRGLGAATTCPECGYLLTLHQQQALGSQDGPVPLAPGLVDRARTGVLIAAALLIGPLLFVAGSAWAPKDAREWIFRLPGACIGLAGVLSAAKAVQERRARRSGR